MNEGFVYELQEVCKRAKELKIKICLDVAKPIMSKIGCPDVYALRLDYGFKLDEIVKYYKEKKYVVELNASTISFDDLLYLKNKGVSLSDIRISHNFFPKKGTGLGYETVIEKNKKYHELGLNVGIYIPCHNQKRPPMYEGLPTCEDHRNMSLYGILSTIRYLDCDEVFFGDAYASKDELELMKKFDYETAVLPMLVNSNISVYEKELLKRNHHYRPDAPTAFVRSSCRCKEDILPHNTIERNVFDVTIDNAKFGRYQGEVCIMKEYMDADERVNVVGKVLVSKEMLKSIWPGRRFRLVIVGEYDD